MARKSVDSVEGYDRVTPIYDGLSGLFHWGRGVRYRGRALALAGVEFGDTVLDVGCGSGMSLKPLQQAIGPQGHIVAIDPSARMIQRTEARVARQAYTNVTVLCGDAAKADLATRADLAFFSFAWFGRETSWPVLRNVCRFLKPRGRLCFLDVCVSPQASAVGLNAMLWLITRLTGESYADFKWDPADEIGPLLSNPVVDRFHGGTLVAVAGRPGSQLI